MFKKSLANLFLTHYRFAGRTGPFRHGQSCPWSGFALRFVGNQSTAEDMRGRWNDQAAKWVVASTPTGFPTTPCRSSSPPGCLHADLRPDWTPMTGSVGMGGAHRY